MWIPKAVKLGLSTDEFWKSTPKKLERYQEFFLKRKEEREEELSRIGWFNGMYVLQAIGATFGKSKYPKSPFWQESIVEEEEETQPMTDADFFSAYAMAFNKKEFGEIK